jgi:syntaxin 1B/2/3
VNPVTLATAIRSTAIRTLSCSRVLGTHILSQFQSSYPPQASSNPYQPRRTNPFAQQDGRQDSYQMSEVQNSSANLMSSSYPPAGSGGGGDMTAFYAEIGSIQDALREFNDSVARIGDLHNRSLNNTDDAAAARVQAELDALVDQTSARSQTLKGRIQALARMPASGRDVQIKRQQTQLVREKFKDAIQSYQQVEQQFRQRYKQRMERQFKIVKPDATPDEIRAVVEDTQGGQVFQQAVGRSCAHGQHSSADRPDSS